MPSVAILSPLRNRRTGRQGTPGYLERPLARPAPPPSSFARHRPSPGTALAPAQVVGAPVTADPADAVAVRRPPPRSKLGDLAAQQAHRLPRARDVRDREGELARARREARGDPVHRADVGEAVEERVELVGIVVVLAVTRPDVDRLEARARVGLGDREGAEQERSRLPSAPSSSSRWCMLTGICTRIASIGSSWAESQRRIAPATTARTRR